MNKETRISCIYFLSLLLVCVPAAAQAPPDSPPPAAEVAESRPEAGSGTDTAALLKNNLVVRPKPEKPKWSKAIQDNSFLIEEAYNQERGVVHHIQNAIWFRSPSRQLGYSFTQEWPVISPKHQLSYMVPYSFPGECSPGMGDIMVNYRYQLTNEDDNAVSLAPRISLLLPSGSVAKGLGSGTTGVQLYLPASKRVSEKFVVHGNAGITMLPHAQWQGPDATQRQGLTLGHLGGSVIWLQQQNFNVMMEYLTTFGNDFDDNGKTFRYQEHIISPGVRFAINLGSLQIVPGIAVPLRLCQGRKQAGVLFYLSFEHPFVGPDRR